VTFEASKGDSRVVEVADNEYILDAAERAGLDLPATCRGGICGACVVRVSKGAVDMSDIPDLSFTLSEDEAAKGMALICMARATEDTTVETQCDWGYSLGVGEWQGASGKFEGKVDPLMGKKWEETK
jgi:2Fe-2S type ferredoxin